PTSELVAPCRHCVRTGSESGLVAYWRLDDGVAGQSNVGMTTVADCTPFNNDGVLHPNSGADPGHDLTDPNGNFIPGVPIPQLIYPEYTKLILEIQDATPTHAVVTEICSGAPIRVCLKDAAGNPPPLGSPFLPAITWEYSPTGAAGSFVPVPASFNFSSTQFCFNVVAGSVTAANCGSPSPGFEDKFFQAKMVVTDPVSGNSCTYFSSVAPLKICCPVTPPPVVTLSNVQTQNGPLPLNGTLCVGDQVTLDVSLTGLPAWFPPTSGNVVTINWDFDDGSGFPISLALPPGTTQFPWSFTVGGNGLNDVCFTANIQNCGCPLVTVQVCIPVDPVPVCGTIDKCPSNTSLTLVTSGCPSGMTCYEICPGDDAELCFIQPFSNCNPSWEFSFDNVNWTQLGNSNPTQNTNTLPCDDVGSPYEWLAGQQCIYYRVLCYPLSLPMPTTCVPCTSNVIRICLKLPPPTPVIVANPNPVCQNGGATPIISVTNFQNFPPGTIYTWFCNGAIFQVGSLSLITPSMGGYYW
ncbi:MAG: hypothetical protein AAB316_17580, partial [Bacteroidota bacterium]